MLVASALGPAGTFWFFSGISILGLMFAIWWLPETAGKGLEETNELYAGMFTLTDTTTSENCK